MRWCQPANPVMGQVSVDSWRRLTIASVAAVGRGDELDAIPERVVDEPLDAPVHLIAAADDETGRLEALDQCLESTDEQGRMRFPRRPELGLHPEVDVDAAAFEPTAATGSERLRLRYLAEPEDPLEEPDGPRLLADRHRQLHVIEPDDLHRRHPCCSYPFCVPELASDAHPGSQNGVAEWAGRQ